MEALTFPELRRSTFSLLQVMTPPSSLLASLNYELLQKVAYPGSMQRGKIYAETGTVRFIDITDRSINAQVIGSDKYGVKIALNDNGIEFRCTCPMGYDGEVCKHCVATCLVALDQTKESQSSIVGSEIEKYVESLSRKELAELLTKLASENDHVRSFLELRAIGNKPDTELSLAEYKSKLDEALNTYGFIDSYDAYEYANSVEHTLESLNYLIDNGKADMAMNLAEYASFQVKLNYDRIDDSLGYIGNILDQIGEIHLRAAETAKPDPIELAESLFDLEIEEDLPDPFEETYVRYAHLLGDKGKQHFAELAREHWNDQQLNASSIDKHRIATIMKTIAKADNDIDLLVHVLSRDLESAHQYVAICDALAGANRQRDLLKWALRGVSKFGPTKDSRLTDIAVRALNSANRSDEARNLLWKTFVEQPSLTNYKRLKLQSEGKRIREEALSTLRDKIASSKESRWMLNNISETIVDILLHDNEPERAWEEAHKLECSHDTWMKLAIIREDTNPADSIDIYKRHVEQLINQKKNQAYAEAIKYITHIEALCKKLNDDHNFRKYVAQLARTHKAKRNLMALWRKSWI